MLKVTYLHSYYWQGTPDVFEDAEGTVLVNELESCSSLTGRELDLIYLAKDGIPFSEKDRAALRECHQNHAPEIADLQHFSIVR